MSLMGISDQIVALNWMRLFVFDMGSVSACAHVQNAQNLFRICVFMRVWRGGKIGCICPTVLTITVDLEICMFKMKCPLYASKYCQMRNWSNGRDPVFDANSLSILFLTLYLKHSPQIQKARVAAQFKNNSGCNESLPYYILALQLMIIFLID